MTLRSNDHEHLRVVVSSFSGALRFWHRLGTIKAPIQNQLFMSLHNQALLRAQ